MPFERRVISQVEQRRMGFRAGRVRETSYQGVSKLLSMIPRTRRECSPSHTVDIIVGADVSIAEAKKTGKGGLIVLARRFIGQLRIQTVPLHPISNCQEQGIDIVPRGRQ